MLVVKIESSFFHSFAGTGRSVLTLHHVKVGHGDEEDEGDEEGDGISCCKNRIFLSFFLSAF